MKLRLMGAFAGERGDEPLDLALETSDSLFRLLTGSIRVDGEIRCASFATRRPIRGEIVRAGRRAHYRLAFVDDAGNACELIASQSLTLERPPRGFSMIHGEVHVGMAEGAVSLGTIRLRLDPRNGFDRRAPRGDIT